MSDNGNKGAGDASLMLRIRAEALKGNLDRVKDFLQTAPSRRREIEKLETDLKALQKVATSIDTSLYRVKAVLNDEIRGEEAAVYSDSELQRHMEELRENSHARKVELESILEMTQDAKDRVATVIETIGEMKRNCFQIPPQEPVGVRLKDDLTGRIKNPTKVLAEVRDTLTKGLPDASAWQKYGVANLTSQDIFAEYVDFLGGMALRDIGFDEGISRLAEDLIRTYATNRPPKYPWLALPAARREAVAKTLASIVRVGFPEWTIWALPFTAYAFWHVIARDDFEEVLTEDLGGIPERYQSCLGDAFATFTMGPAYAYAAFYLLLSPLEADAAQEADGCVGDDTRARAILAMLNSMSASDTLADIGYGALVENLNNMWTAALEQAGAGNRTPRTTSDNAAIVKMVESLRKVLRDCDCASFSRSQWDQVETLDELQVDRPLQIGELRSVLNAMWKARIDPATKNINAVAEKVRRRIMKKKIGQGAAPSPNVPSKVTAQ